MTVAAHFADFLQTRSWRADELRASGGARSRYTLLSSLTFVSAVHGPITAPAGMETDFASIPRFAFGYIAPDDPAIEYASVIHDFLYNIRGALQQDRAPLTRQQCDAVLREAMLASGARPAQAAVVYSIVRIFGGSHWKEE